MKILQILFNVTIFINLVSLSNPDQKIESVANGGVTVKMTIKAVGNLLAKKGTDIDLVIVADKENIFANISYESDSSEGLVQSYIEFKGKNFPENYIDSSLKTFFDSISALRENKQTLPK